MHDMSPRMRALVSLATALAVGLTVLAPVLAERVHRPAGSDAAPTPSTPQSSPNPSHSLDQVGSWTAPEPWPVTAVHAILLHTGKVLFWRGDEEPPESYLWDPATHQVELRPAAGSILFCGGHSVLEDGRVLVAGGEVTQNTGLGPVHTHVFDPASGLWSRTTDMRRGRYYPTNVTLGDGRVLVFSGTDEAGLTNDLVEAFVRGTGGSPDSWELLSSATRRMTYYPRMHLLPSGQVYHTGPERSTSLLEPLSGNWTVMPASNYGKRTQGSSVMLPPGFSRIMILGGRDRSQPDPLATATAEVIDMSAVEPSWRYTAAMHEPRMNHNAVLLPDGKVLVVGGTSDENITPSYSSELFDPVAETWTLVAPMATHRGYHSSALLLPDGRVLVAGANGNYTAEVFSPPYLYKGPRPVITSAPASVPYGGAFAVATPDAATITSVVLMRPGASTHAFDMGQRYIPLPFTTSSGVIDTIAPTEPNIAPAGYYMLFLVNGNGVPSAASFVHLDGSLSGNRPPRVDAGVNRIIVHPQPLGLDGTVADDGLPAPPALTTLWTMDSGPGAVTFTSPGQVDTTATFPGPGTWVLRLTAGDGELSASDTVTVQVNALGDSGYPIESRILDGHDDAEETASTGVVSTGSGDLELTWDESDQVIGLRFTNLPIPPSETIVRAWLQFQADEKQSDPTSLTIHGQAADNPPGFSGSFDISSRPLTTASAAWAPLAWEVEGEIGSRQRSSDLAAVIQEIVNRPGWSRGNALVLILSGSGHRTAEAFDGGVGVPVLHVELGTPPVNEAPLVTAGMGQIIRMPAAASLSATVTDDGLPFPPGSVQMHWAQESGPGLAQFANANAPVTTVTFTQPGRYELGITADDGQLGTTEHLVIEVLEELPGAILSEASIVTGSDDAEETVPGGSVTLTSSDLEMVMDEQDQQVVGLRFASVSLPLTATVHRAWIQFTTDEATSASTALTIQGIAQAQPATFEDLSGNVSARPRTAASVAWTPPPWTLVAEAGPGERTPDLTGIIRELAALPGRTAGGPMAFLITGSGSRVASAFEKAPARAARLVIEYN